MSLSPAAVADRSGPRMDATSRSSPRSRRGAQRMDAACRRQRRGGGATHDGRSVEGIDWMPDGRHFLIRLGSTTCGRDIVVASVGDTGLRLLLAGPSDEFAPATSPDGQWFAYVDRESGRDEVFVRGSVIQERSSRCRRPAARNRGGLHRQGTVLSYPRRRDDGRRGDARRDLHRATSPRPVRPRRARWRTSSITRTT